MLIPVWLWLLCAVLFIIGLIVWLPKIQIYNIKNDTFNGSLIELENQFRLIVIQALGFIFFVITAFFSWLNFLNLKKSHRVAEVKQIIEPFSKATEMLGQKDSPEARLGGIYTLEHIGISFPETKDKIIKILTSFIQDKSCQARDSTNRVSIPVDIETALTVVLDLSISQRMSSSRDQNDALLLYIRKSNLSWINFDRTNLFNVCFLTSNLRRAYFLHSNLCDAKFEYSDLSFAHFHGGNLSYATFKSVNLTGASFSWEADLFCTSFIDSILFKVNFDSTRNLTSQQLDNAIICNISVPREIKIDTNRDCDRLASILCERYPEQFASIEEAEEYIQQ